MASDSKGRTTVYHLTDNPRFKLDKTFEPQDNSLSINPRDGRKGLYVGEPEVWSGPPYGYKRPYVVELSMPSGTKEKGRWGGENFIPAESFDDVKVERVMPYDHYVRRKYGVPGDTEDYLKKTYDTDEPLERTPGRGMARYPETIDVKKEIDTRYPQQWSDEDHKKYLKNRRDFLHDSYGWGWNEFDDQGGWRTPEDDEYDGNGELIRRDREGNRMTVDKTGAVHPIKPWVPWADLMGLTPEQSAFQRTHPAVRQQALTDLLQAGHLSRYNHLIDVHRAQSMVDRIRAQRGRPSPYTHPSRPQPWHGGNWAQNPQGTTMIMNRVGASENPEADLKAAGIAVIAMDTGRVLMLQRALNPITCPCGQGVTWDEQNGYQHDDGSVSHDDSDLSVSEMLDQGHDGEGLTAESAVDLYNPDMAPYERCPECNSRAIRPLQKDFENEPNRECDSCGESWDVNNLIYPDEDLWNHGFDKEAALEYDKNEGVWEFPGGCLEDGEPPRTAAVREFREEVGQDLPPGVFVGAWLSPGGIVTTAALTAIAVQPGQETYGYGSGHTAPSNRSYNAPFHDLESMMPDYYDRPELYNHGSPGEWEALDKARAARGNPEKKIRIYRAVPHGITKIYGRNDLTKMFPDQDPDNLGEWVSVSKEYAQQHARSESCPKCNGPLQVISGIARAKDLLSEGYPTEQGYVGDETLEHTGGNRIYKTKCPNPRRVPKTSEQLEAEYDVVKHQGQEAVEKWEKDNEADRMLRLRSRRRRYSSVTASGMSGQRPPQHDTDWLSTKGYDLGWRPETTEDRAGSSFWSRELPGGTRHFMIWSPTSQTWGGDVATSEGRSPFQNSVPAWNSARDAHHGLSVAGWSGRQQEQHRQNRTEESNQGYRPFVTVEDWQTPTETIRDRFQRLNSAEGFSPTESEYWQFEENSPTYAVALQELEPSLRFGSAGYTRGGREGEWVPQHHFAHDDDHYYDSRGRHPLDHLDEKHDHVELDGWPEDWGAFDPEKVRQAREHAVAARVLSRHNVDEDLGEHSGKPGQTAEFDPFQRLYAFARVLKPSEIVHAFGGFSSNGRAGAACGTVGAQKTTAADSGVTCRRCIALGYGKPEQSQLRRPEKQAAFFDDIPDDAPMDHVQKLLDTGWKPRHPEMSRSHPDFTKLSPTTGVMHTLYWDRDGSNKWLYDAIVPDNKWAGGYRNVNHIHPMRAQNGEGSIPLDEPGAVNHMARKFDHDYFMGGQNEPGIFQQFNDRSTFEDRYGDDPPREDRLHYEPESLIMPNEFAEERTRPGNPMMDRNYRDFNPAPPGQPGIEGLHHNFNDEWIGKDPSVGGLGKLNSVQAPHGDQIDFTHLGWQEAYPGKTDAYEKNNGGFFHLVQYEPHEDSPTGYFWRLNSFGGGDLIAGAHEGDDGDSLHLDPETVDLKAKEREHQWIKDNLEQGEFKEPMSQPRPFIYPSEDDRHDRRGEEIIRRRLRDATPLMYEDMDPEDELHHSQRTSNYGMGDIPGAEPAPGIQTSYQDPRQMQPDQMQYDPISGVCLDRGGDTGVRTGSSKEDWWRWKPEAEHPEATWRPEFGYQNWPGESARIPSDRDINTGVTQPLMKLKDDTGDEDWESSGGAYHHREDPEICKECYDADGAWFPKKLHKNYGGIFAHDFVPMDPEPGERRFAAVAPVYKGFIYLIQNERDIDLGARAIANPDDPDGDMSEQCAWWDIEHAKMLPALRKEVKTGTPWEELELWADKSVRTNKQVVAKVQQLSKQTAYDEYGNWYAHPSDAEVEGDEEETPFVYHDPQSGRPRSDAAVEDFNKRKAEVENQVAEYKQKYKDVPFTAPASIVRDKQLRLLGPGWDFSEENNGRAYSATKNVDNLIHHVTVPNPVWRGGPTNHEALYHHTIFHPTGEVARRYVSPADRVFDAVEGNHPSGPDDSELFPENTPEFRDIIRDKLLRRLGPSWNYTKDQYGLARLARKNANGKSHYVEARHPGTGEELYNHFVVNPNGEITGKHISDLDRVSDVSEGRNYEDLERDNLLSASNKEFMNPTNHALYSRGYREENRNRVVRDQKFNTGRHKSFPDAGGKEYRRSPQHSILMDSVRTPRTFRAGSISGDAHPNGDFTWYHYALPIGHAIKDPETGNRSVVLASEGRDYSRSGGWGPSTRTVTGDLHRLLSNQGYHVKWDDDVVPSSEDEKKFRDAGFERDGADYVRTSEGKRGNIVHHRIVPARNGQYGVETYLNGLLKQRITEPYTHTRFDGTKHKMTVPVPASSTFDAQSAIKETEGRHKRYGSVEAATRPELPEGLRYVDEEHKPWQTEKDDLGKTEFWRYQDPDHPAPKPPGMSHNGPVDVQPMMVVKPQSDYEDAEDFDEGAASNLQRPKTEVKWNDPVCETCYLRHGDMIPIGRHTLATKVYADDFGYEPHEFKPMLPDLDERGNLKESAVRINDLEADRRQVARGQKTDPTFMQTGTEPTIWQIGKDRYLEKNMRPKWGQNEFLSSLVGRALGADVSKVMLNPRRDTKPEDNGSIFTKIEPGYKDIFEMTNNKDVHHYRNNVIKSPRGVRLGLLDTLVNVYDHDHINHGTKPDPSEPGGLAPHGIDYESTFHDMYSPNWYQSSPYANHFIGDFSFAPRENNALTQRDVLRGRRALESLRPAFKALGREDDHDALMYRWEQLEKNAGGAEGADVLPENLPDLSLLTRESQPHSMMRHMPGGKVLHAYDSGRGRWVHRMFDKGEHQYPMAAARDSENALDNGGDWQAMGYQPGYPRYLMGGPAATQPRVSFVKTAAPMTDDEPTLNKVIRTGEPADMEHSEGARVHDVTLPSGKWIAKSPEYRHIRTDRYRDNPADAAYFDRRASEGADLEEFASRLGRALSDVNDEPIVPEAVRGKPTKASDPTPTVYVRKYEDFKDLKDPEDHRPEAYKHADRFTDTPRGKLIGYFHAVLADGDHQVYHNMGVVNGKPVSIDHTFSSLPEYAESLKNQQWEPEHERRMRWHHAHGTSPFERHFLAENSEGLGFAKNNNPLAHGDTARALAASETLRPWAQQRGREDWLDAAQRRMRLLGRRAGSMETMFPHKMPHEAMTHEAEAGRINKPKADSYERIRKMISEHKPDLTVRMADEMPVEHHDAILGAERPNFYEDPDPTQPRTYAVAGPAPHSTFLAPVYHNGTGEDMWLRGSTRTDPAKWKLYPEEELNNAIAAHPVGTGTGRVKYVRPRMPSGRRVLEEGDPLLDPRGHQIVEPRRDTWMELGLERGFADEPDWTAIH